MLGLGLGAYLPLFVYLVAVAVVAVSFSRPIVGIATLALLLPMHGARYRMIDYPLGIHIPKLLLIAILIGVIFNRGSIFPPKPMRIPIIALCTVTYISLWVGMAMNSSVPLPFFLNAPGLTHTPFSSWLDFMHMPLLFILACATVQTKRQMQVILFFMMVAFLWNVKNFYGNVGARETTVFVDGLRSGVGGDFGGSNGRAAFSAQCTLMAIALFGCVPSLRLRVITTFLIAGGLYCVMFSYSRGAYAGFLMGLLYLGFFRMRWLLLLLLVLAPFATVLVPASVVQRVTMTYDDQGELEASSAQRLEIWQHAWNTTMIDPVLGIGFDTYRFYRKGEELRDTHNMYLKAVVETGVIGLICLLMLFFRATWLGHRLSRTATDPLYRALGSGFAAYMICVMVTNVFGDRWTYLDLSAYTWLLLAFVVQATLQTGAATPAPAATTA